MLRLLTARAVPGPTIGGAFDILQVDLVPRRIASRAAGNYDAVTGLECVFGDALPPQSVGVGPFGGKEEHRPVRVLGHHVQPGVGAPERKFEQLALN